MSKPGFPPHPQRQVHPALIALARARMREGGLRAMDMAANCGFPNCQDFSKMLDGRFSATPLVVERFRRVAELLGYDGDPLVDAEAEQRCV